MSVKTLLVTGGAGYIGSHFLLQLQKLPYRAVILDSLVSGHVNNCVYGELVVGDIQDTALIDQLFSGSSFDAVIHFAASTSVPESVQHPERYYLNNTVGTLNLINACIKYKVKNFLFSSTAAVYGLHESGLVTEHDATHPINAYGQSKLMAERMLQECAKAHGINAIVLRYFNVAGVDPSLRVGPHSGSQHLLKAVVDTALGRQKTLDIYGDTYPTADGTGVRDFIHVNDLIAAHVLALDKLMKTKQSLVLNCGYGHGYSVKEVLSIAEQTLGQKIPTRLLARRKGDCPVMIADPSTLKTTLDWHPQYDNLSLMVESLWNWEKHQEPTK